MLDAITDFFDTKLYTFKSGTVWTVEDVFLVFVALVGGYLLSRTIEAVLARKLGNTSIEPDVIYVIKRVSFYVIFLLVGLTVLSLLGIPITAFAFATGAIAIGVGFGAQNIINNFISGWILIAERPIRINDFIEIDGAMGVVERVGTRSTLINRIDGVHMLIPNSRLLENTLVNWTLVNRKIRTSVRVGVAYGSDPELVIDLLKRCVEAQSEALSHPTPEYVFEDFGDSALIFDVYFWCYVLGEKTMRSIRSELRIRINSTFQEHGITIAFPQLDVHVIEPTVAKVE